MWWSRRVGRAALLVAQVVLVGLLSSACSGDDPAEEPTSSGTKVTLAEAQTVLSRRARALRDGDLQAFLRGIDRSDRALVQRQRRYFENLRSLPPRPPYSAARSRAAASSADALR